MEAKALKQVWAAVGGNPSLLSRLIVTGIQPPPPMGPFHLPELCVGVVGATALAAAEIFAQRNKQELPKATVGRLGCVAAFHGERLNSGIGWNVPELWDPIAGNYKTDVGWIRLHTNYEAHRNAVLRVLGVGPDKREVEKAVSMWLSEALESAVVREGGCAAVMHTRKEWLDSVVGQAVCTEPLVHTSYYKAQNSRRAHPWLGENSLPLGGVRVLDLTRVIAGPVCTRALGAYGADVLRIDPPNFADVPAALPETSAGKRRAYLDLKTPRGRDKFMQLVSEADVLVVGYRGDAMSKLGLSVETLREHQPNLIVARLNAYGWTGEWKCRRGFDSLVQMSTGIAEYGMRVYAKQAPVALPVQALDHATGHLLAAAVMSAITEREKNGKIATISTSLAAMAEFLWSLGVVEEPVQTPLSVTDFEEYMETVESGFGTLKRVKHQGHVEGMAGVELVPPGPLGVHEAEWLK